MALVELAQPGPFVARTLEMGYYIGLFEHGQLLAMAGERLRLEAQVELSAICTHPSARGRGLAERLVRRLMHDTLQRGQHPFLHVLPANAGAIAVPAAGLRHPRSDALPRVQTDDAHGRERSCATSPAAASLRSSAALTRLPNGTPDSAARAAA